jgi:hypothetical protein
MEFEHYFISNSFAQMDFSACMKVVCIDAGDGSPITELDKIPNPNFKIEKLIIILIQEWK